MLYSRCRGNSEEFTDIHQLLKHGASPIKNNKIFHTITQFFIYYLFILYNILVFSF